MAITAQYTHLTAQYEAARTARDEAARARQAASDAVPFDQAEYDRRRRAENATAEICRALGVQLDAEWADFSSGVGRLCQRLEAAAVTPHPGPDDDDDWIWETYREIGDDGQAAAEQAGRK